ncbi:MAG TPA: 50S ribosomal protein L29 [Nitrospirales bacterium]|nr:50S ribosomal protein L29 [Nitrospirales bacterium]
MDTKTLRNLDPLELEDKEKELKKELFNLRFQHVTGRLENPARLRSARREIARVRTISREKIGSQGGSVEVGID